MLDTNTRGDILSLTNVVVVSTSMGHPEGYVWLDINGLDYQYTLRKLCTDHIPIHEDKHIKLLIDEIIEIRESLLHAGDGTSTLRPTEVLEGICNSTSMGTQANSSGVGCSSRSPRATSTPIRHTISSAQKRPVSLDTPLDDGTDHARRLASPNPASKPTIPDNNAIDVDALPAFPARQEQQSSPSFKNMRRKAAGLAVDGFEVKEGVNLSAPTAPRTSSPTMLRSSNHGYTFTKGSRELLNSLISKKRPLEQIADLAVMEVNVVRRRISPECISETPIRPPNSPKVDQGVSSKMTPASLNTSPATSPRTHLNDQSPSLAAPRSALRIATAPMNKLLPDGIHRPQLSTSNEVQRGTHIPEIECASAQSDTSATTSVPSVPHASVSPSRYVASDAGQGQADERRTFDKAFQQGAVVGSSLKAVQSVNVTTLLYKRVQIPKDQMEILENSSSWIPPLPGKRFPEPNVPIKLLEQWRKASPRRVYSKATTSPPAHQPHGADLGGANDDNGPPGSGNNRKQTDMGQNEEEQDEGDDGSADDEEIFSDWESSPAALRPHGTPPDSSPPRGAKDSSQNSDLAVDAPRALVDKVTSQRSPLVNRAKESNAAPNRVRPASQHHTQTQPLLPMAASHMITQSDTPKRSLLTTLASVSPPAQHPSEINQQKRREHFRQQARAERAAKNNVADDSAR